MHICIYLERERYILWYVYVYVYYIYIVYINATLQRLLLESIFMSGSYSLAVLFVRCFRNCPGFQTGANTKNGPGPTSLPCSTINSLVPRFPNYSRSVNKVCSRSYKGNWVAICVVFVRWCWGWVKPLALGNESSEMFWGWSDQDPVWWVQGSGAPWHDFDDMTWDIDGHCEIHTSGSLLNFLFFSVVRIRRVMMI